MTNCAQYLCNILSKFELFEFKLFLLLIKIIAFISNTLYIKKHTYHEKQKLKYQELVPKKESSQL